MNRQTKTTCNTKAIWPKSTRLKLRTRIRAGVHLSVTVSAGSGNHPDK